MDYFLKSTDEAALVAALLAAGILFESTEPIYEEQETGNTERCVVLDDGEDEKVVFDPKDDYLQTMISIGYKITSDKSYPAKNKVQTGERVVYHTAAGCTLDIIGTIHKPTGAVQTVDGLEVPEIAAVPGWHANLRGELSDTQLAALEPILLDQPPAQPYRVWA